MITILRALVLNLDGSPVLDNRLHFVSLDAHITDHSTCVSCELGGHGNTCLDIFLGAS